MFDFSNDFVRRLDVESMMRLNDFLRIGMRSIHDNVHVTVVRIFVHGVERRQLEGRRDQI